MSEVLLCPEARQVSYREIPHLQVDYLVCRITLTLQDVPRSPVKAVSIALYHTEHNFLAHCKLSP